MLELCGCWPLRRTRKATPLSKEKAEPNTTVRAVTASAAVAPIATAAGQSLDEFGLEDAAAPKRRTIATLESVKSKFIRHLSYEKEDRNKVQSSPSKSEEEIARRAELRRFRVKRIQEELSSDHNKTNSTHTSIRSTRYLSPYIDIGLPGHGPRDAIEFSIDSGRCLDAPCPSPAHTTSSSRFRHGSRPMKRWSSCPAEVGNRRLVPPSASSRPASAPLSRSLLPPRNTYSPMQHSLISRGSSPKLSRTNPDETSTNSSSSFRPRSEPQTAFSRRKSAPGLAQQNTLQSDPYRSQNSPTIEFEMPSIIQTPNVVWRRASSQRPASIARGTMEQRLSRGAMTSQSRSRQSSLAGVRRRLNNTSSASSQRRALASSTPGGISSSYYPSGMPSIQPSPTRSNPLANVLSMRDLQSLELSPFQWHDDNSVLHNFGTFEDCSSYVTADDGDMNFTNLSPENSHPRQSSFSDSDSSNSRHSNRDYTNRVDSTLHQRLTKVLNIRKRHTIGNMGSQKNKSTASVLKKADKSNRDRATLLQLWPSRQAQENAEGTSRQLPPKNELTNDPTRIELQEHHSDSRRNLSGVSAAYVSLQKVARRNISAPPLSWSSNTERLQSEPRSGFAGRGTLLAENRLDREEPKQPMNMRSSSFPFKIGNLVRATFIKDSSHDGSDESVQPKSTQTGPKLPQSEADLVHSPRIDEIQPLPALGELELFTTPPTLPSTRDKSID